MTSRVDKTSEEWKRKHDFYERETPEGWDWQGYWQHVPRGLERYNIIRHIQKHMKENESNSTNSKGKPKGRPVRTMPERSETQSPQGRNGQHGNGVPTVSVPPRVGTILRQMFV